MDVHYKAEGSGEPTLVLVHGLADSLYCWREVMPTLAASRRTVALDLTGFGLTERPMPGEWSGESPYSSEGHTALTLGLADELAVDEIILVGHSMGGAVAMSAALAQAGRVRALILVDPAVYTEAGAPDWLLPLLRTPQMRRLGPLAMRTVRPWEERLNARAWHDPTRITPELHEAHARLFAVHDWDRALWEFLAASGSPGLIPRLGELDLPVLVITGDDDRVVPTEESIRLAGALPNARLVVISDCGHAPQEECPELVLEAIQGFLASYDL
jgi:pimeloyl-ACP methyl ester carboxylesterase